MCKPNKPVSSHWLCPRHKSEQKGDKKRGTNAVLCIGPLVQTSDGRGEKL